VISHEDWDYPNRGSSKYFMAINCIHTTTPGARNCFQTIEHRATETQNRNVNKHPCPEWDSNTRSQCLTVEDSMCLTPCGHCDRLHYTLLQQELPHYKTIGLKQTIIRHHYTLPLDSTYRWFHFTANYIIRLHSLPWSHSTGASWQDRSLQRSSHAFI
jgi:hypothetical protein